jgi:hypothetical protein
LNAVVLVFYIGFFLWEDKICLLTPEKGDTLFLGYGSAYVERIPDSTESDLFLDLFDPATTM